MADRKVVAEGVGVTRLLANIGTDRMEETRDFYVDLLGFIVGFEHAGWYIQLASPDDPQLQLGIVCLDHEFTPSEYRKPAQGVMISAQVKDVDAAYASIQQRGFPIAHAIRDESFGMRRFMVADPNGVLVNIFSFP